MHLLGTLPKFVTTPSVVVKDDGLSYIIGCQYVVEKLEGDLAIFAHLVVNEMLKVKLNGRSKKINKNTYQLPEHKFIEQGKYQCLIEAPNLYKESILSDSSVSICIAGRINLVFWYVLLNYKSSIKAQGNILDNIQSNILVLYLLKYRKTSGFLMFSVSIVGTLTRNGLNTDINYFNFWLKVTTA